MPIELLPAHDATQEAVAAPDTPLPRRGRGRPPGAKNKTKPAPEPVVEAPAENEPESP